MSYSPPIYEDMSRDDVDLDVRLRELIGWPTRRYDPPTDEQLGAAFRAAASNRREDDRGLTRQDFLTRLGLELDQRV